MPSNCHRYGHTNCKKSADGRGAKRREEKERLPTAAIKRAYTTQRRWMEKMLDKFALNDKSSQLDRPSIMRVIVDYFHPRWVMVENDA